ncbi:DUF177 domain-containing protein [Parablautia intestinalis]|uniref:DUF177 domain-containing protein n=2 Tax=Parablautia intestinalis TaxID=2320100 RepID=A0A3A9B2L4_9FIRM|nr:DUF177 domain-containing protein [Lachnospiraceae bacterium]MDE7046425.1 DUF177 domain-containing protein [Lachnospiraceae bacterium]RKI92935.1 DUF177 domain-containing protein [Parablautia intestinalis]
MLISLADVFTSEGKDRRESIPFEPDRVSYMGNSYKICEKSPVNLIFTNIGIGKILLQGQMRLVLEIPCDRCLQVVHVPLALKFEQEIFAPDLSGQVESGDEQQNFMLGYELNVEAFVKGEILINMPVKVLCKPDCKGICKQCGHNLNEGECGCDTFVPDPRMASIKDIFNAGKEV